MFKNIDVVILCGGLGTRLKKITSGFMPKPMVKIGKQHFLDIIINYMAKFGFRRFVLCIGHKGEVIKNYYKKNKTAGINILYSFEKKPLGTGGAVKKARGLIRSRYFIVLNGDSFCEFDPLDFLKFHNKKKALVSILLRSVSRAADYGKVKIDKSHRIIDFNEKDSRAKNCLINAGVYVFDKKVFGLMPRAKVFSLERDFFPSLSSKNCFGYTKSGFFIDIGTPKRYFKANKYFLKRINNGRS